ncbi:26559_t:CDS:1, partial [Racocetra persica]
CYEYNQEGHISRNCPTKILQPQPDNRRNILTSNQPESPEIRGMNIHYLEVTEAVKNEVDEYLRIELKEGKSLFDIRNLGKGRRIEDDHEMLSWAQKSTYGENSEEIGQFKSGSIIYIPIAELTNDLDILKM